MCVSALHRKTKTSDKCIKMNKNFNTFYIFGPVALNSQSITVFDSHAALCQLDDFRNVNELKK